MLYKFLIFHLENQELSDHNSSLQKSLNVAEQKLLQDTTSWMAQISQRDEIVKRLEHTITDLRHDLQITYDKVIIILVTNFGILF